MRRLPRGEISRIVRQHDELGVELYGPLSIRDVATENQFRAGFDRRFDFGSIKAIDRKSKALTLQSPHRVADTRPRLTRHTTEIDHVGPRFTVAVGLTEQFIKRKLRCMVDLSQDFDVVLIERRLWPPSPAEELGQIEHVFRTALKGDAEVSGQRFHLATTPARNDHALNAARHGQLASHPVGSQQSGHRYAKHRNFVLEPRTNGQRRENFAQRQLGQTTGYE